MRIFMVILRQKEKERGKQIWKRNLLVTIC